MSEMREEQKESNRCTDQKNDGEEMIDLNGKEEVMLHLTTTSALFLLVGMDLGRIQMLLLLKCMYDASQGRFASASHLHLNYMCPSSYSRRIALTTISRSIPFKLDSSFLQHASEVSELPDKSSCFQCIWSLVSLPVKCMKIQMNHLD